MRSYRQYCAVAQALDLVGDRWALLIVRELLIRGPLRYTDLQYGVPGIATDVLAERIQTLERAGVVRREAAPPPVARALLDLTERGRELRPVIDALCEWGAPLVARPIRDEAFRSHWLTIPIEALTRDATPAEPRRTIEIRTGDQPVHITIDAAEVRVLPGRAPDPDVVLTGTGSLVLGALLRRLPLAEARRRGLKVSGRPAALRRLEPKRPNEDHPARSSRRAAASPSR